MLQRAFSGVQALVMKEAEDGTAIGAVCRKTGISEATSCAWRKRYAELMPSEIGWLHQVKEEDGKLKRLVVDLSFGQGGVAG